jgi:DNA-nicking Smr family endonuclease
MRQSRRHSLAQARTAQESATFRAAGSDVTPLPTLAHPRIHHDSPPIPTWPEQSLLKLAAQHHDALPSDTLRDLALATPNELADTDTASWRRNGISLAKLRDLRRGRHPREAQLDLHGHTRETARQTVAAFLSECHQCSMRCVRIVHGKGLSTPNRTAILKPLVHGWLRQSDAVLAYCEASTTEGGSGAVFVLLSAR